MRTPTAESLNISIYHGWTVNATVPSHLLLSSAQIVFGDMQQGWAESTTIPPLLPGTSSMAIIYL